MRFPRSLDRSPWKFATWSEADICNACRETRGLSLQKIWGQNMRNFGRFIPLQSLIANIFGTTQDIQHGNTYGRERCLLRLLKNVRWTLVHWLQRITYEFGPTKMHFFGGLYIFALGCYGVKFLHALAIDQGFLAHTPLPKNVIAKIENVYDCVPVVI